MPILIDFQFEIQLDLDLYIYNTHFSCDRIPYNVQPSKLQLMHMPLVSS